MLDPCYAAAAFTIFMGVFSMFRSLSAALALGLIAAPALADMTQPPQYDVAIWAYPQAENYCPEGLEPVRFDGMVSCGVPNRTGYGPRRRARRQVAYVAYGKGADDYVAYSKSPGK